MPTKNRAKLIREELELFRTARRSGSLELPTDKLFQTQVRQRAKRLMRMAALDVQDHSQLLLVVAIIYDQLTKNLPAGRRRRHSDNDEFDLLDAYAKYRAKLSKLESRVVARVTNGLCLFDEQFVAYRTEKGPEQLSKRFERAWQRLRADKLKKLDTTRRRRRGDLLKMLETRFGKRP